MVTGNTKLELLDIFKEHELVLEPVGLRAESVWSSLCISGAVADGLPTLQMYPEITIVLSLINEIFWIIYGQDPRYQFLFQTEISSL